MFKTLILAGAAAIAAAAPATPAAAQTEQSSVVVPVGDLDLSKPSDAARLSLRLPSSRRRPVTKSRRTIADRWIRTKRAGSSSASSLAIVWLISQLLLPTWSRI